MPNLTWKVQTIKDDGPGTHYRYHITGLILDGDRDPRAFSWSVPSLDDPTYDISTAVRF